jgi:very-short-patch-repair endonuclease
MPDPAKAGGGPWRRMGGRDTSAAVPLFRYMPDRFVLQARARAMRREPTFAEKALWKVLREKHLAGLRFRRQVAMGAYIADFACFSPRLIVELDGAAHWNPEYDAARDRWFEGQGFKVLRFSNDDAIARSSIIVEAILKATGREEQRLP